MTVTPFTLTYQGQDAGDGDKVDGADGTATAHVRLVNPDDGKAWVETWPWTEFVSRAAAIGLVWTLQDPPPEE